MSRGSQRSEVNLPESFLSSHQVGPGNQTQVSGLAASTFPREQSYQPCPLYVVHFFLVFYLLNIISFFKIVLWGPGEVTQ